MNISFLNLFRKKEESALVSQDKIVLRMNRLLASEQKPPLRDLMRLLEVYFGESVISIVYGTDRVILATTGSRDDISDIENVAYRIKDTENKEYYLRSEVNGLYFRKGIHCLRIFPFSPVVNEPCFLMVEQESVTRGDVNIDRVVDFLSIAVRLRVLTEDRNDGKRVREGELLSRDEFLERLRVTDSDEESFIGVFHFSNMRTLNEKLGNKSVDAVINGISSMLKKAFPESVCQISTTKFAVVIGGEMYSAVCALQDVLDEISDSFSKAKVKCVATKVCEDIYKVMYICEKASENVSGDAVVVIRECETDFDSDNMEETTYYQAEDMEEVEDISFKEVKTEPVEMEEARKEYQEKKKREAEAQKTSAAGSQKHKSAMGDNIYTYENVCFDYNGKWEEG